jgi:hypothetical protein
MDIGDKRKREEVADVVADVVADEAANVECAICLENNFPPENPLKKLRCNHKFDLNCLRTLNNTSSVLTCPMCRAIFSPEDYEPPPPPPQPQYDNNGLLLYSVPEFGHLDLNKIVDTTRHFSAGNILIPNLRIEKLVSLFNSTQMVMNVNVNIFENGAIITQKISFIIIQSSHRNSRGNIIKPPSVKEQIDSEIESRFNSCNYGLLKNVRILNKSRLLGNQFGVMSGFPLTNYYSGDDLTPAELFADSPYLISSFARSYGVDNSNKCLMKNLLTYTSSSRENPQFKRCTINFFTSIVVIPPDFEHLFGPARYERHSNPFSNILNEFDEEWIFPFKNRGATCSVMGGNKKKTNKRKRQTNKRKTNKRKTNKRKTNKRKSNKRKNK